MVKPVDKKPKASDANTEERIMEAAKIVFMKYGLYGARMQDIADTAGINKALLHYYYRSKEKLFDRVFEGALQKYFQQLDVFADTSVPIRKRLLSYVDRLIAFLAEYPQMSLFIIKEVSENPELFKQKVHALKKTKHLRVIDDLEAAMARGEIKKTDPVVFMVNLQSLCFYPFIAAPLFRHMLKAYNKDWNDFTSNKHKQSIKRFIEHALSK